MFLDRQQARRVRAALCFATMGCAGAIPAAAQQAPAGAASSAELTPAERAQRDADKVFKWILIHADKPRKPSPARDEKREEKPVAAARAKPVARTAESAPVAASAAASLAVSPQPATAPVAAAAPAVPIETPIVPVSMVETRATLPGASPSAALVAAEAIDETLTPLFRAEPQFPASVLRTLRKGAVELRFTVLPDGSVADAAVVTSTNARLNPSALAAIAKWRFAPLRKPQEALVALGFDLD
jgi:TonB family protein